MKSEMDNGYAPGVGSVQGAAVVGVPQSAIGSIKEFEGLTIDQIKSMVLYAKSAGVNAIIGGQKDLQRMPLRLRRLRAFRRH